MNAWVFPGQGSQFVGMGTALHSQPARETFAVAGDLLGWDVLSACAGGPAERLNATEVAQPAILTVSVAAIRTLFSAGLLPGLVAGHSVGEFAALVAAKALSFEDALRAVAARGDAMAAAGRQTPGAMAAVLGLREEDVHEVCAAIDGPVVIANVNGPGQVVVSGERDAVELASAAMRAAGARRVIPLAVSVAAHSPLMAGAQPALRRELETISLERPQTPFISCLTGRLHDDPASIRDVLVEALTGRVRWTATVAAIGAAGAATMIEVGPGQVLTGLARRIAPALHATFAGDDASVAALAALAHLPALSHLPALAPARAGVAR